MKHAAILGAVFFSTACASLLATPIVSGDIAIYRVGDGSTAISATTQAVFIDEYTPAGVFVQSIAVPSSGLTQLTDTGNASTEGELTLSTDGQYLAFAGYDLAAGGANGSAVIRVVGSVNVTTGAVDTSTRLTIASTYSGASGVIRGAATQDGTQFWLSGNNSSGTSGGTRLAALGANTSSTIQNTIANTRAVAIFNGQLYTSTSAGTVGVYTVGTGVPTGAATPAILPAGAEFTASAYNSFYFTPDGQRLFVTTGLTTNSIQAFVLTAGNWTLDKTFDIGATGSNQITAFTLGTVTSLFYTAGDGTGANTLRTVAFDSGTDAFGLQTTLATAAANETFKGLALVGTAVPEPATSVLMGLGLLLGVQRLRRRK